MVLQAVRDLPRYQKLVIAGLFVCLGVTGVLFAGAMSAHVASHHADFMEVTAVDHAVHEQEERITVTLEIENPSNDDFVVRDHLVRSEVDGEAVTYSGRQVLEEETVLPAGESVEIAVSLRIMDDRLETVRSGSVTFDGTVAVEAHGERYFLSVETPEEGQR